MRIVVAHQRWRTTEAELFSVGVGDDLDDAVLKSSGPEALYFEYVEDSPMGFDED